jgi:hypothetical protein
MWNVDLEKAIVDFAEYKKVKKLAYVDGKAIVISLFVNDLKEPEFTETEL